MATPLVGSGGGSADSFLPSTGFGPGSLIIALIGGAPSVVGVIARRLGRRPSPAA
jgi:hypothetical protein